MCDQTFSVNHSALKLYLLIITNYNQQNATFLNLFISTDALHVPGGSSAHHQEHTNVHTASGIVNSNDRVLFFFFVWARGICSRCTAAYRLIVQPLYYPTVLDVPTFATSQSPRPCNPRDPK